MKDRPETPAPENKAEKPAASLPINVPMNIIRWLLYSVCFFVLLTPFKHTVWEWICGALILGWFAGLLNAIANK